MNIKIKFTHNMYIRLKLIKYFKTRVIDPVKTIGEIIIVNIRNTTFF